MKLSVELKADEFVSIIETFSDYLSEKGMYSKNKFHISETVSVDIFKLNSVNNINWTEAVIVNRAEDQSVPKIKLKMDGWFTAIHIVIPNSEWVYRELSKPNSIIKTYDIVYFAEKDKIYSCKKGVIKDSSLEELLNEDCINTTISKVTQEYVNITNLTERVNSLYIELFKTRIINGGCKLDPCEANRLESLLHLISHYVRVGQLAEAQRVIEKSNYFQDFKKLESSKIKITSNCGCS